MTLDNMRAIKQRWRHFFYSLCLLASLACGMAHAKDHITERAWREDKTGQQSWAELQRQAMTTYNGPLSVGFGSGAIWLRLHIDPNINAAQPEAAEQLVLRIRPAYLDKIELFDPLFPQGIVGRTGDLQHPRHEALQGLDFLLRIPRGAEPRDIWLRLSTTSTRQIDVQALSLDDLNQETTTDTPISGLYIALILVLSMWGIVQGLFSKEPVICSFGLKQLAALFYALTSLGYIRLLWPSSWSATALDQTATISSILGVSTAILFHIVLQSEFDPPPWVRRLHQGMLVLQPLKFLMLLAGSTIEALRLNMLEVMLAPPIFLLSVLLARGWHAQSPVRPSIPKWAAIGFYVILVLFMLLAALPGLGLTEGSQVSLYVVQTHGLFTAFLVLLMLAYRSHVMQGRQQETALALDRSLMQAQQEREIRHEQDNLLAMLAHELKTPLATMYMRLDASASGSNAIKQAIKDMNGVIERCLEAAKLSDRQLRPHFESIEFLGTLQEAISACQRPQYVRLTCPPGISVNTDPQLIFLVLNNLLENACKYAAPDTPIIVNCICPDEPDKPLTLTIANQPGAAGWPQADKVFQKYYRSPHARRQAGTGLGLFVVQNLMYALSGKIDYAPTETHVKFVLQLPRTEHSP